jgi:hypothetical protein
MLTAGLAGTGVTVARAGAVGVSSGADEQAARKPVAPITADFRNSRRGTTPGRLDAFVIFPSWLAI